MDEWDDVTDNNRGHALEAWMYPHRDKCDGETDRVWAQQNLNGKYEMVMYHKDNISDPVVLDVANIEEAKAMALALFKMR